LLLGLLRLLLGLLLRLLRLLRLLLGLLLRLLRLLRLLLGLLLELLGLKLTRSRESSSWSTCKKLHPVPSLSRAPE
jgi:hypothetical protein